MTGALSIGLSALEAHKQSMRITSNNIANAATEGYTRQDGLLVTPEPETSRPGAKGRGVNLDMIRRQADVLLIERLRAAQSEAGRLDSMSSSLTDLELVYNEPGEGGLSNTLNNLFATFDDLSNNPESSALRTSSVEQLQTFVSQISSLRDRMSLQRDQLALAAEAEVAGINRIAGDLADLNNQIRRQSLTGLNPNDLLDQRDNLLKELSFLADARVIENPREKTVRVEVAGRAIVTSTDSVEMEVTRGEDNVLAYRFADTKDSARINGGVLGGLRQLSQDVLPAAIDGIDELAGTIIHEFNKIHSTGTSHTFEATSHIGDRKIVDSLLDTDLDSPLHSDELVVGEAGLPDGFRPDFTDGFGNIVDKNLTINVLDTTTGEAQKFTVRYERGSDPIAPGRSLNDLVSAINSGRGGGFELHPPIGGGIPNVDARVVPVSDGNRLQLSTSEGFSIDFSQALDLDPADQAWTGADVAVSGSDPTLADQRLLVEVSGGGTTFDLFTLDPQNGQRLAYPTSGSNTIAIGMGVSVGSVSFNAAAGTYSDGQTFAVDFDGAGNVETKGSVVGTHTHLGQWTGGSASMRISGRYTGEQTFHPDRQWSMRVLNGGVVGAEADVPAPGNPPTVEFTYYDGPIDAPVEQTRTVVLDDSVGPGDQFEIAEGVFAVFSSGDLSAGDQLDFTVDGHPDQAGLLAALGMNSMFTGSDAQDIAVNESLIDDAGQLSVSTTRSAGDNSNILRIKSVRDGNAFGTQETTLDDFYQGQVADVAVQIQQVESLQKNQTLVTTSLENRRDEVSGVSIDEEVGLLIMQQQAYTAAARIVTTERENIDTLLGILA